MALFEPASQNPNFDILYQQYLARQKNTENLLQLVGDSDSLEGDFESLEDVVAALVVATGKLNTVVNTTSESPDYELSVGETAVINITAASTPLNIAVEDGVYSINVVFDHTTFAADSSFGIQINNADQAGAVIRCRIRGATDIATDEVDTADTAADRHMDAIMSRIIQVKGELIIMGNISSMTGQAFGIDASNVEQISIVGTRWGGAHTSLGTIVISEAATGVCYVTRMA
jgi:hypothetical protein